MIFVYSHETIELAIKRQCAEQGHDFSHESHRCWNCNILYKEVNAPIPSFDNDYRFIEGRHIQ